MTGPALLAVSHGTDDPAGRAAVLGLVAAVAARLPDVEVRLGHVDVQQPDVEVSLADLPGPVVIVPLLLSAGYHVHVDLPEAIGARTDVAVSPALGPDRRLAAVLATRLGAIDAREDVVLAVAGSSDERANAACREQAALLASALGVRVSVGFLAAAEPRIADAVAAARRPVVAAYLLAPGYFHDLAVRRAGGARVAPPLLDGGDPPADLVDLVVDRYVTAAASGLG